MSPTTVTFFPSSISTSTRASWYSFNTCLPFKSNFNKLILSKYFSSNDFLFSKSFINSIRFKTQSFVIFPSSGNTGPLYESFGGKDFKASSMKCKFDVSKIYELLMILFMILFFKGFK